jgi:hypothetical protein
MKKIEYKVENIKVKRPEFLNVLNAYGQDSWELVYMNIPACIFKRTISKKNKFEYNIIDISAKNADIIGVLNEQGQKSWEMVYMNLPSAILKREIIVEGTPAGPKNKKK